MVNANRALTANSGEALMHARDTKELVKMVKANADAIAQNLADFNARALAASIQDIQVQSNSRFERLEQIIKGMQDSTGSIHQAVLRHHDEFKTTEEARKKGEFSGMSFLRSGHGMWVVLIGLQVGLVYVFYSMRQRQHEESKKFI